MKSAKRRFQTGEQERQEVTARTSSCKGITGQRPARSLGTGQTWGRKRPFPRSLGDVAEGGWESDREAAGQTQDFLSAGRRQLAFLATNPKARGYKSLQEVFISEGEIAMGQGESGCRGRESKEQRGESPRRRENKLKTASRQVWGVLGQRLAEAAVPRLQGSMPPGVGGAHRPEPEGP